MRSLGFTLILLIAAILAGGAALWQSRDGSFSVLFGVPPTEVGERLYSGFRPDDVKHIRVTTKELSAVFSLTPDGWKASTPWDDRMDPRAAVSIINFTLGMRVEDVAPVEEIDTASAGVGADAVIVRLEDGNRAPLARYQLGRITPWKAEVDGIEEPVPTVFVLPRDRNRRSHVYSCSGDINPLFKEGLRFLRDHRPFYFNPVALQMIRIRTQEGDLTLGRQNPESPWRIVKPLDLPTDPAAIKNLLEGLYELHALRLRNRAEVTLSDGGEAVKTQQIAIRKFGSEVETVLEIHPPEAAEALEVLATVSDRPGTVFDLPLKPDAGLVPLASLPLSVNDLRDPRLTHLNIASLRGIAVIPSTGAEISISRQPPQPWMASVAGETFEANEENLFSLLKAVTSVRAIGFESDAAVDFSPWGLDRPFLRLRFLGQDNQGLELRFGLDAKGGYFVNRLGTPTVVRVDESMIAAIAVRPHEWRHARVWSLDRTRLLALKFERQAEQPLVLKYNDDEESWSADVDGRDVTNALDPAAATFLLSQLEGFKVARWLAADDEKALAALEKPGLTITATEFQVDDEFETTGILDRTVRFAPGGPGDNPGFYYGRLDGDDHPFMMDAGTYERISARVLEP